MYFLYWPLEVPTPTAVPLLEVAAPKILWLSIPILLDEAAFLRYSTASELSLAFFSKPGPKSKGGLWKNVRPPLEISSLG